MKYLFKKAVDVLAAAVLVLIVVWSSVYLYKHFRGYHLGDTVNLTGPRIPEELRGRQALLVGKMLPGTLDEKPWIVFCDGRQVLVFEQDFTPAARGHVVNVSPTAWPKPSI